MATPFFHVDVQQPAEMRFNRARVRRAFVTIGQRHMRDARRLVIIRPDAWLVRLVTWCREPVKSEPVL